MLFIDSSALVALLAAEPDRARIVEAVESAENKCVIPIVLLETTMVLSTRFNVEPKSISAKIRRLFTIARIEMQPVTALVGLVAIEDFERFGKGRGHPARLNMADCRIYAAAKVENAPLLFIGDDFTHTDIKSVLSDPSPR